MTESPLLHAGTGKRVIVRTLPLSTGNYGGILQAWALQQTLRDLGHDAAVDLSTTPAPAERIRRRVRRRIELAAAEWGPAGWAPEHATRRAVRPFVNQQILRFLDRLQTVQLYDRDGSIDRELLRATDAFVVGSDQVWRADYGDVGSYLLDGLPPDLAVPRIAYAASFGVHDPPLRLREHRAAAEALTAVSVREDSGIEACRRLWGVEATRVVDPTMLISAERYADELVGPDRDGGGLVTYVLDWHETKRAIVHDCGRRLGIPARQILPASTPNYREARSAPSQHWLPSVEGWLKQFSSADFVVTDSFHGTVFAILFHKPFLVIPNVARGTARFDTVLRLFGLEDRLVVDRAGAQSATAAEIDWQTVDARMASERERALGFLAEALADPAEPDSLPSSECHEE